MRTAATYFYHAGIFGILAVFAAEFAVGGWRTITRTMRAFLFFRVGHKTLPSYGAPRTTIARCLSPTFRTNGLPNWIGCSSPSILITRLTGGPFELPFDMPVAPDPGGNARGRRSVATTRQLATAQVIWTPGVSTSTASFGANASVLNSPSPQRTPEAS